MLFINRGAQERKINMLSRRHDQDSKPCNLYNVHNYIALRAMCILTYVKISSVERGSVEVTSAAPLYTIHTQSAASNSNILFKFPVNTEP